MQIKSFELSRWFIRCGRGHVTLYSGCYTDDWYISLGFHHDGEYGRNWFGITWRGKID